MYKNQKSLLSRLMGRNSMSEERLKKIAKELANNANMPYCWEDVYNRLVNGYALPFKVEVK